MRLYQRLFTAGIAAYVIQIVLALVYYKERMVLPDDANYIFDLVTNGGRFAVFHYRFIAAPSQVLPFIAVKLGWPLAVVARLYSLNLVLFPFACYLVCGLVYKNFRAALVLLLSGLLFTSYTFYWAVSELGLCIWLFLAGLAILTGDGPRSPLRLVVLAGITATVACSHTLAAFVVGYVLLYLWISRLAERRLLLFTAGIYGCALVFKMVFLRDAYDAHAMGGLRNFIRLFPDYFSTESARRFRALCMGKYGWIPVTLALNVWAQLRTRRWRQTGLMLGASISYLILVTVTFPDVNGHDFYSENLFLPIAVFLSLPLVYDALPLMREGMATALVVLIVAGGLYRIWDTRRIFSARLDWQRGLIRQYEGRKAILNARRFPQDTMMMAWSAPYELWLLSTIEQGSTASIIITDKPDDYTWASDNPRIFLPAISSYPYETLNRRYFILKDTTHTYQVIKQ